MSWITFIIDCHEKGLRCEQWVQRIRTRQGMQVVASGWYVLTPAG